MPITQSAKKSLRVSIRRAAENKAIKSRIKNQLKTAKGTESIRDSYRILDKAAKNHIIHPNKAARLKSRLAKRLAGETSTSKPISTKTRRRKTKTA
jgi:small subunit ribosomal protein S20